MTKNLLLEIGLEELPAHVVFPSMNQLKEKTEQFLTENRLAFDYVAAYSTPRRLAIQVVHLAENQEDVEEEVKGPAKKIALDQEGNWSKAAQGFVRGQGVTTEDITFKEIKGVDYVYVTKHLKGKPAIEVVSGLREVITSLTFPVTMHWNRFDFEYIRPIRWLVALLGEEIIPMQILNVQSDRVSRGHRFLGKEVTLSHADEYLEKLSEQFVIADPIAREQLIVDQIEALVATNGWKVDLDEDLLEEVVNLVEFPTAFIGNFDAKYLSVPEEVLVTSMKEHQRYFDLRDSQGRLLPHFISVRNGNSEKINNVIKGNEKVLIARLEDAEFFYSEDQKLTIAQCVEKLKNVTFHEKIGSIFEKMTRVGAQAQIIGKKVGLNQAELDDLARAAEVYKFDLVTNMVGEFPELQGIMGEKYALLQGESAAVAKAIREHYLPISSEGELPVSRIGAVLAVADKLDSVLSFFAAGLRPSGSNDPYALRRQTYGIVRIIADQQWSFFFKGIQKEIEEAINANPEVYGMTLVDEENEVLEFLFARLRQYFVTSSIRHDVIEAVIKAEQTDIHRLFETADVLNAHVSDEEFKPSIEALTRVINLAKKATFDESPIDQTLFENDSEVSLAEAVANLKLHYTKQSTEENYYALIALRPLIDHYFEKTMVMVEDEKVRANRLSLLKQLAQMARSLASLDLLITK